jgi:Flp pilus assembly protein TadG
MFRGVFRSCVRDQRGAVGPAYAVGILALVAVAGIGFDYGRLASLDSELQNGADQAALAGATQLDGEPDACDRAAKAVVNFVQNHTRVANDGLAPLVKFAAGATDCADKTSLGGSFIKFWQDRDKETPADPDDASTAHFIEVSVDGRSVNYALTPLVGAVSSGLMEAKALAGLGTAICRSPPVMMCNPEELDTNTDTLAEFPADSYHGVGMRLISNSSYTPGAFGYLDTGYGNGANDVLAALGWDTPPGECIATGGVEIKDGVMASVLDGIRARFDVPGNGTTCPTIDGVTGVCSPSVNSRKDLVRGNGNCNNTNDWSENDSDSGNFLTRNYRPLTAAVLPSTTTPEIMGYPRDLCHAFANVGNCDTTNGGKPERIGTGDWDIQAYWRSNYAGASYANVVDASYGPQPKGYPTRYQVYRWEADHIVANDGQVPTIINGQGSTKAYAQPQANKCLATPGQPYGIDPAGGTDRRRVTVAVLNCTALQTKYGSINNKTLEVGRRNWVDVFLTEPPLMRSKCTSGVGCNTRYSEATDVYVEIIERTEIAGGGDVAQMIRRDVPYLIQ